MGHQDAVRLANPPAADQPYLRTSLVPGLLRAVERNTARGVRGVALFEAGHVFRPGRGENPVEERESVGAVLAGTAVTGYPDRPRPFDFSDAKGALESLMASLAIEAWDLGEPPRPGRTLHPARSAGVRVAGRPCGVIGELHPRVAEGLGLPDRAAVFELDVEVLGQNLARIEYREVSRFPPLRRDLAFIVPRSAPAGELVDAVKRASAGLADSVVLFDVFEGTPVPQGKKSVAFSVDFRALDRTLSDDEVNAAVAGIVAFLAERYGAELRTA
jgi:phenylalanyl-tRNA synthetase beta chain